MTYPARSFSLTDAPRRAFVIAVALVVAALVLLPIYIVRFPPINDYPFHLARMIILAQLDNPIFARFYELGSFLLPNVGMDAVVVPLSTILGPERATRVFVELTLLTMLLGAMALHWAAHRRLSVWPLLAVAVLHNGIFRFGFFNYLFGLGLAFAAAALWLGMRRGLGRSALAFLSCIVLIFCHMEAFGVFALIVGGIELQRAFMRWRRTPDWAPVLDLVHSAAPFVLTLALFAVLSPAAKVIGDRFRYESGIGTKPIGALFSLSSGIPWLDAVTAASIVGLCAWLLLRGRLAISPPLATGCFMLLAALFALPSSLMGSLYADTRLGPAIALAAIAALDIRADSPRFAHWVAVAVVVLLAGLRTAVLSSSWIGYNNQIAPIVSALDNVERGATLFSATSEPFVRLIADTPERAAAWRPPVKHLASYAVLHAPIFVPMTFADPTKQPLVVVPPYQPVKDFQGDNPAQVPNQRALSAFIGDLQGRLESPGWPRIASAYLLVMGRQALEPMNLPVSVSRVAQGDRFVLLRLSRRAGNDAR